MSNVETAPTLSSRPRGVLLAGIALTVLVSVGAFFAVRALTSPGDPPAPLVAGTHVPVPPHPAVEARYGIHVVQVGLSADGGLLDLRFQILDANKAEGILGHHSREKILIVDENNQIGLDTRTMTPGDSNLLPGTGYYVLFRNTNGTVKRGDYVDLLVGNDQLPVRHVRVL
jgi:hypothetical protein